jgi:hypothetical protein
MANELSNTVIHLERKGFSKEAGEPMNRHRTRGPRCYNWLLAEPTID